jgi:hypothetical protein
MPRATHLDSDLFADVLTKLQLLSRSQQRFIHEILAGTGSRNSAGEKSQLKKSYGIWADRTDIQDSVHYVNELRKGWDHRMEISV